MSSEGTRKIADILKELDQRAAYALMDKKYDEALNIYREILRAQEGLGLEKLSGHTLLNMANICMLKGEFEEALSVIDRASKLKSLQKDDIDRGNLEIFRANSLFLLERSGEAENVLLQELKKNRNSTSCGQMEMLLFHHYRREKKNAKARGIVDKAISHFRADHNKEELIRALRGRVQYFLAAGQKMYAELDLAEIKNIEERGA